MRPRRLEPRFFDKVWGSAKLEPWFRDSDRKIGEVWFQEDSIPLLVKFLFTTDKLSVQVHPGDDYARQHHDSRGKTEMWHVLSAEPGARIAAGFRKTLSAPQARAAAQSGEIEDLLEWFEARPGDTFFIPAGVVHAIGGGLVICEIQQHSDVTYRFYDYGRPRELHLDRAEAVSDFGPHAARVSGDPLVCCEYFTTRRIEVNGRWRHRGVKDELLIVIAGTGSIADQPISAGDVWLISGATDLSGNVTALLASS